MLADDYRAADVIRLRSLMSHEGHRMCTDIVCYRNGALAVSDILWTK